jgi:hypothetical protein
MPNTMWNGNYGDDERKRRQSYDATTPTPKSAPIKKYPGEAAKRMTPSVTRDDTRLEKHLSNQGQSDD